MLDSSVPTAVRTEQLTTTEAAVLALLAIEGERSGYDLLKLVQQAIAHVWSPARSGLYAVLPRLARNGLASHRTLAQSTRPDKQLYAITPDGRAALDAVARDGRARRARDVLPQALRRRADDAGGPARARRAVRRRHRGAARRAAGDRADELEPRQRLVPPPHAPLRDRPGRARARRGRRVLRAR